MCGAVRRRCRATPPGKIRSKKGRKFRATHQDTLRAHPLNECFVPSKLIFCDYKTIAFAIILWSFWLPEVEE